MSAHIHICKHTPFLEIYGKELAYVVLEIDNFSDLQEWVWNLDPEDVILFFQLQDQ